MEHCGLNGIFELDGIFARGKFYSTYFEIYNKVGREVCWTGHQREINLS